MGQEHDRKKIDLLKKLFPVLDEHEIIEVLEARQWDFQRTVDYLINEMGFASDGASAQAVAAAGSVAELSEDEQIKRAIELSKQSADSDLQRALEMSRMESKLTAESMDVEIPGLTPEELQLQRAISASIQTEGANLSIVSTDPNTRKRVDGVPVGIQNIGNTCYFNSFIQTYFMIPQLCQEILTFPIEKIEQEKTNTNRDIKNFMKELQRLFGLLVKTNQKWVDPTPFLKTIVDNNGQIVKIGSQEDVSEFSELFLQRLEKGLELSGEGRGRLIRDLFYVDVVQYISCREEDGTLVELQQNVEFTNFLLPVTKTCTDLHASLETFMWDTVDYKTPKGRETKADSFKWLRRLPHILMFQQNRVVYDSNTQNQQKVQLPLSFDKTIYMDRYMLENKEETLKRRNTVSKWRERLSHLKNEIENYENFQNTGIHFDSVLLGTLDYLKKLPVTTETETAINLLTEQLNKERETLKSLKMEVEALSQQINSAYNDMNKHPFELFGVWIHSGQPSSGHYWAYIRDLKQNKWIKFNDIFVSFVEEDVVFKDAVGSPSSSVSAYFLIYMSREFALQAKQYTDYEKFIPLFLDKEIEASNKKFIELLENYNKNSDEGKVQRFIDLYEKKVQQSIEYASFSLERDLRVKSLYAFLYSLGLKEQMHAMIIKEVWALVFEHGIDKDLDSKRFQLAKRKVPNGEELFRLAVHLQLEGNKDMKLLMDQHRLFQETFLYLSEALTKIFEKQYFDALRFLVVAWRKNEAVEYSQAKRSDISLILKTLLFIMWDHALENITQPESVPLVEDVVAVSTHLLEPNDPLLIQLRDSFFNDILMHHGRIPPKLYAKFEQISDILLTEEKRQLPKNWVFPSIKTISDSEQYDQIIERTKDLLLRFRTTYNNYIKKIQPEAEQNKIKMEQETINEGKNVLAKTEHTEIPKDLPPLEDSDSMQEE